MNIEVLPAYELDLPTAAQIMVLRIEAWPHLVHRRDGTPESLTQAWSGYRGPRQHEPRWHLLYDGGQLLAAALTLGRTIATGNRELTILGLASVCVAAERRGRGFGRFVVKAAFGRIDLGEFQFSMFQTTPQVEPFYRRLGAVPLANRIYNSYGDDPAANPFWDPVIMRYPATGDWPTSDIDLRGPGY